MQVFAQKGVVNTKMNDIAIIAGIGKGTIYEYFSNKEDIFQEAFNKVYHESELLIEEAIKSTDDPEEKLKYIMEISLTSFMEESKPLIYGKLSPVPSAEPSKRSGLTRNKRPKTPQFIGLRLG